MAVKPIIIPLVADTAGLTVGIEALEQLGTIDAKTAADFKAASKAFADRGKTLSDTAVATDKLVTASKKLGESIIGGGINKAADDLKKYSDALKNIPKVLVPGGAKADLAALKTQFAAGKLQVDALATSISLAKKKLQELEPESKAFNQLEAELKASLVANELLNKSFTSTRGQLRAMREALLQLEDAGLEGTKVFENIAVAAGELNDQVGDTQARIKALGSDTFKFDAAIQAVQGLAGAFSIAQGAAALFGQENEDVQKALLKVQAAMAILNGLQQIQQLLQKESAVSLAAQIALQRVQVLQTNLQAATESRFIVVRYAAAAAQRVLNAVMEANPAGVVLFAIAALATALVAFTQSTDKAAEAQKKLNQDLETFIKISELSAKVAKQQGDVRIAELEKQRASAEEIRNAEAQNLRDQVNIAKNTYDKANANLSAATKKEREAREAQIESLRKSGVSEAFIQNAIAKQTNTYTEERVKAAQLQQETAQKYFDLENQLQVKRLQDQKDNQDDALKSATAAAEARVAQTKKGSQAELQAQIAALKVAQQEQLAAEGITAGEREKIIAENERAIAEFRLQIQTKNLDDQIALAQAKALQQEDNYRSIQERIRAIVIKYEKDRIGLSKDQAVALEKQKNEAIIKVYQERRGAFEQFEEEMAVIMLTAERDALGKNKEQTILIETQKNEAIRSLRLKLFGDLEKAQTDLNVRVNKADQDRILQGAKNAQEELALKQQNNEDQLKATENRIQREKELEQRRYETALQTASSLAQSVTEIAKNNADAQIAIEQQRLEQGLITQQQFDQRSRSIRRRAAQEEKQMAIFQAGIALSLAILSVLKDQTIPPPAKPIFIALASVAALAQIAAIQSKPIPAFKKGTRDAPGGPSLVGEAGPELIYSNGNWQYTNKPTVLDLPKHAKVIPTLDTQKILSKYDIPMPSVQQHVNTSIGGINIDYGKLGRAVGKEIAKLPLQQNSWDENGYNSYQTSVAGRKSYLNTKYRSPR